MLQKTTYHHGELRTAILHFAMKLLREKGVKGVSIRAVANMADVSQTAIYHHYKNKNILLCALASEGFKMMSQRQEAIFAQEESPSHSLKKLGMDYVSFSLENPHLFILMFGATLPFSEWADELRENVVKTFMPLNSVAHKRIEKYDLPFSGDAMALSSWTLVHGLSSLIINGRLGPLGGRVLGKKPHDPMQHDDYLALAGMVTDIFAGIYNSKDDD